MATAPTRALAPLNARCVLLQRQMRARRKLAAEDPVAIAQQILRAAVPRKCLRISSFHATLNRGSIQKGSPPFFDAAALGVNMTPMVPGFVVIQVTGAFNAGSNAAPPGHVYTTTPQLTEDVSLVRGNHQIQFGANFVRPIDNFVINLATFGNFNFNGQITGLSMGDLLLGDLNTFQQANAGVAYDRQKYIGAYVQD